MVLELMYFHCFKKTVTIEKLAGEYEFASIQLHHTMMGRDLVKETTASRLYKRSMISVISQNLIGMFRMEV